MNPLRIAIILLSVFFLFAVVGFLYLGLVTEGNKSTGPSWEHALGDVSRTPIEVGRNEEVRRERENIEQDLSGRDAFLHIEHRAMKPCIYQEGRLNDGDSVVAYEKRKVPFGQECVSETRLCSDGELSGSFNRSECLVENDNSCYVDGLRIENGYSRMLYSQETAPYPVSCLQYGVLRTCSYGTLAGDGQYKYADCEALPADDCVFEGETIKHGDFIRLYQRATVPSKNVCVSEARICQEGALSGSYTHQSCTIEQDS